LPISKGFEVRREDWVLCITSMKQTNLASGFRVVSLAAVCLKDHTRSFQALDVDVNAEGQRCCLQNVLVTEGAISGQCML
jgi:hypothetical protein